jgi:benzoate membrane transport protein
MSSIKLSHLSAGFIAVLVGYTSSAVIIFQAASAAGASQAEISSWMWALGIGMGLSCIGLSLYYRQPILTAWSTPGAALLITSLSGLSLQEATGAFILCSLLIMVCGITGWFEQLIQLIPQSLASAMLAGVLFQFGLALFTSLENQPLLVGIMLLAYLLLKEWLPRYAIPSVLLIGISIAATSGQLVLSNLSWQFSSPILTTPHFSLAGFIGISIPLFIVTMASQNIPGIATLRAHDYHAPASPLIGWTGLTGLVLAPFGGFAFNLAAITAAICMGKDADEDPSKRYLAAIWAGVFYLITGLLGASVVGLFAAFPKEMVLAIAGLALLNTIGNSLAAALADNKQQLPALITFLVTSSGLTLLSIGSGFWGLIFGLVATFLSSRYTRGSNLHS